MDKSVVVGSLERLMQLAKNEKQNVDDGEISRHWAVLYTELEKMLGYYKTFLESKESES